MSNENKVRVALIDSAIKLNMLEHTIEAFTITDDYVVTSMDQRKPNWLHGTTCAKILCDIAPNIELICIDIFDKNNSIEFEKLNVAIQFAVEKKCLLINLSIASTCFSDEKRFYDMLSDFWDNTIFIVSCANSHKLSYPAIFEKVISVESDKTGMLLPLHYLPSTRSLSCADFIAQPPESITIGAHCLSLNNPNSYATPVVTAQLANLLENTLPVAQAKNLLTNHCAKKDFISLKNDFSQRLNLFTSEQSFSTCVLDKSIPIILLQCDEMFLDSSHAIVGEIINYFYNDGYNVLYATTINKMLLNRFSKSCVLESISEKTKEFLYAEAEFIQADIILLSVLFNNNSFFEYDLTIIINQYLDSSVEIMSKNIFNDIISKFT